VIFAIAELGETVQKEIKLPSIVWNIETVPGSPGPVEFTYNDQYIPYSIRQKVPADITHRQLLFGDRKWMKDDAHEGQMRPFNPREHKDVMRAVYRLKHFYMYNRWCAGENIGESPLDQRVIDSFSIIDSIAKKKPELKTNVTSYQEDSLHYWNETYDAVDQFILFPICPRQEMKNDEAMLGMIEIFEELGVIYKTQNGTYKLSRTAADRVVFQYGDVLSIKKWYSLRFYILRKMTEIGKEDYVQVMMCAYDRFVKVHDYLHENIHRVQLIYKYFYGGFIQAVQALLGAKRIGADPTKGSWKEHKVIVRKMYLVLMRVRMERFMIDVGHEFLKTSADRAEDDVMWDLQKKYDEFCVEMEHCKCSKTRYCAIFMKLTDCWLPCDDSVGVGDWALLEVYGCDWLDLWCATGKHQYLLETKRRTEALYSLPWPILEYHRAGRLLRTNKGRKYTTHDDLCEKQNHFEKKRSPDSNFPKVCIRSRHIHFGERAAKEMFGDKYRPSKDVTMEADIHKCYHFYKSVGVFETPNTESSVDDNTFWSHVVAPSPTKNPKDWYTAKKGADLSQHERKALEIFWDRGVLKPCDEKDTKTDYVSASDGADDETAIDADAKSTYSHAASTVATIDELVEEKVRDIQDMMYVLNGIESDELTAEGMDMRTIYHQAKKVAFDENPTTLNDEKAQTEALKSLSGVTRYKLNLESLNDPFVSGRQKLEKVKEQRAAEIALERRKVELIWLAVRYFREKRDREGMDLKETINRLTESNDTPDYEEWELAMNKAMGDFNVNEYFK
jgi:hypothetical protein